jgi:hypothetical protein
MRRRVATGSRVGRSIFGRGADGEPFRYSPLTAALLAPLHVLPVWLGNVMWRLLNAGVLLGGFAAWLRGPLPWRPDAVQQALLFLLLLPLAMGSLNNGQTNPLMTGLLLYAVAFAGADRWNAAAACVAGAVALKAYPLTMGMLLAAAYPRRFGLRLLVAVGLAAAAPFLLQSPGYVAGQYADWFRALANDDRKYFQLDIAYRDLWLLFRVTGMPVSPLAYKVIQAATGIGCAVLCVLARRQGRTRAEVLTAVLTLGTCWMTLCGPATESCTFVLLGPALAWGVLSAGRADWPRAVRWLPTAALALLMAGVFAGLFPGVKWFHAMGPQPLGALLLSVGYVGFYWAGTTRAASPAVTPAQAA